VTVFTPAPGGGTSASVAFTVTAPAAPVIGGLSPSTAVAGSPALTLTVNGSGFVATSVVRWNGANRTTTFVSATQLRAAITAADLATARSVSVTVFTSGTNGGTSAPGTFTVSPAPAPPPPSAVTVRRIAADGNSVTFTVSWGAVSGASSYRYIASFSDGSGSRQGTVAASSFSLVMPYHASGAAFTAQVCVRAVNAAGLQSTDQTCGTMSVPARPPSAPIPLLQWQDFGWG
jgi:hypothetical protein